jgi:hypothetical protein
MMDRLRAVAHILHSCGSTNMKKHLCHEMAVNAADRGRYSTLEQSHSMLCERIQRARLKHLLSVQSQKSLDPGFEDTEAS